MKIKTIIRIIGIPFVFLICVSDLLTCLLLFVLHLIDSPNTIDEFDNYPMSIPITFKDWFKHGIKRL